MRNDRMPTIRFYHTRVVTMLGDAIHAAAKYLAGMDIPTAIVPNDRFGHASDAMHGYHPVRYHRAISLGAWIGLLASGGMCWALILSSI